MARSAAQSLVDEFTRQLQTLRLALRDDARARTILGEQDAGRPICTLHTAEELAYVSDSDRIRFDVERGTAYETAIIPPSRSESTSREFLGGWVGDKPEHHPLVKAALREVHEIDRTDIVAFADFHLRMLGKLDGGGELAMSDLIEWWRRRSVVAAFSGPLVACGASKDESNPDETIGSESPKSFAGGVMMFYDDRVEICGVTISVGSARTSRRILNLLRQKSHGSFVAYGGKRLAEKLNSEYGTVSGAIRDLRSRITGVLATEERINCKRDDVILSGGHGYRLSDRIEVEVKESSKSAQTTAREIPSDGSSPVLIRPSVQPESEPREGSPQSDDLVNEPEDGPVNDPVNGAMTDVDSDRPVKTARLTWIREELSIGRKLRRPMIAAELSCSESTVKRDLEVFADEIEFVGAPKTGYYRLRQPNSSG